MKVEIPILRRCCFCFPSRYGLLIFAFGGLLYFAFFMYAYCYRMSWLLSPWIEVPDEIYPLEVTSTLLNIIFNLINLVFNSVLLVAAHKKSLKIFKSFYSWEFIGVFVNASLIIIILGIDMYIMWAYGMDVLHHSRLKVLLIEVLPDVLYLCIQLYTLSLVKNEINKLSNNHGFRFVNLNDSECVYVENTNSCIRDDDKGNYNCDCQKCTR
ncbi:uncharacterized protein LOC113238274 [Hyposmocoma kahamanoa]|uniref:uncharacterized protein LOC113238274 n=1 Tax=Hyposmocoma kahamanoa TaxID=1477025 RepID=UPI000E6D6863|nr:uncharacterized protein LOC113238274 [Hyposmocoma kahamanoa]